MCGIWLLFGDICNLNGYYEKFMNIKHRGPDRSTLEILDNTILGFHRLSINDLSINGDQPFKLENDTSIIYCICNGEIYNHIELTEKYNLPVSSKSDCEVLIHLYNLIGIDSMANEIIGEFAYIILDINKSTNIIKLVACRDRFGIRPLFISENTDNNTKLSLCLSSEVKGLYDVHKAKRFPPRHYMQTTLIPELGIWSNIEYKCYWNLELFRNVKFQYELSNISLIKTTLIDCYKQMLESDRPICAFLSGGLDSSLGASIISRLLKENGKRLPTFSIGLERSTDEKYAKMVAEFIDSDHTHIKITKEDVINSIEEVIKVTETFDTTTIRASIGQYLLAKWISQNTEYKVAYIGDGSDELTAGYLYFHRAPDSITSHNENINLLSDIDLFDVLRVDRGVASNGLEARVPYLHKSFVELYLSFNPDLRHPSTFGIEKGLLRTAFNDQNDPYLPKEVLYRKKEAFSDGCSAIDDSLFKIIQDYLYTLGYTHINGVDREIKYYKDVWDRYYSNSSLVPYFWKHKWSPETNDPSARTLGGSALI
jgi:asparagine synthase (glutamine-hydrolysing)